MSDTKGTYYTPEELFEIFKEQHRLCAPLDPMADDTYVLTPSSRIIEWRDSLDLMDWDQVAEFLNKEFRVNIELKEWKKAMTPEFERTINDVCELLSQHASKPTFAPVKLFGHECVKAGVFLSLRKSLRARGVDVDELRPSSPIGPYLEKHFSPMVEEVTLTGVQVFDRLEYGSPHSERRLIHWLDKFLPRFVFKRPILAGEIITFRDLVERIVENKPLGIAET
jgi:hypothetical protein